jgi:hypothetical protein
VGDAENPENNGNYNGTTMEREERRSEAYEANTTRVMKHSTCLGRRRDDESGPDAMNGRSDIRSGSEAATRSQRRDTAEWEVIPRLLENAAFEMVLSVFILLAVIIGTMRKLVGVISWVEGQLPLMSPAQEEVRSRTSSQQGNWHQSSMESFGPYRETEKDEANSDSNSQHSNEVSEHPVLSSFPTHPLERDTLEVPTSEGKDSTRASLEVGTVTPLETDSSTPQSTGTVTPLDATPQPTADMSTFRFPMPVPGSEGMPYFSGANITEFLERFEELCDEYQVVDRKAKLPRYCDSARREIVKSLPEWESGAKWEELAEALKEEFRSSDRYQSTYSMTFLNEYIRMPRTNEGLKDYCRQYASVSKVLVARKVMSEVDRGRLFLMGLPKQIRERLVIKFKVDDAKPETYTKYEDFLSAVREVAKSSLTNQALELQREPTSAYKQEIRELVEERGEIQKIPEELKKVPPVVPVGKPSVDNARLDEVVRELAELRIQHLELANRKGNQGTGRFETPINSMMPGQGQGYEFRQAWGAAPTVHVNAVQARSDLYCHYCRGRSDSTPHTKNRCSWLLSDVAKGVIHLDENRMICLGAPRPGAVAVEFYGPEPFAEQIRLKTAGSEYDANVASRTSYPRIYSQQPEGRRASYAGPSNSFTNRNPEIRPPQLPHSQLQLQHQDRPSASAPVPTQTLQNPDRQQSLPSRAQEEARGINVRSIRVSLGRIEEESQDDQPETPAINAAAIVKKGKEKSVSFENPSKVVKQRLRKERYAGLGHDLEQARLESGTVKDIGSDEDPHGPAQDDQADDEMDEIELPLPPRSKPIRRERYVDKYIAPAKKQEALDHFMSQEIVLKVKDVFAFEGGLRKLLGQKIPVVPATGGNDVQVETLPQAGVRHMTVQEVLNSYPSTAGGRARVDRVRLPRKYPSSLAMQTGKMEARLEGKITVTTTIDSGAEVSVMPRAIAERAKLTIQTNQPIVFQPYGGERYIFFGLCREVEVSVGGIVNYVDFFIVDRTSDEILLGMPFTVEAQLTYEYPGDGTVAAVFKNSDRTKQGRVTVAGDDVDLGEDTDSENE